MTDIAHLGFAVDSSSAVKATADLDRLGDQAAVTEKQVVGAATKSSKAFNSMSAPMRRLGVDASRAQQGMRLLPYQLNQIAQSGAVTGMWMTSITQQIPDILAGFGSMALVLTGGAAAMAATFLPALFAAGSKSRDFAADIEALQDALARYEEAADLASMSTGDLMDRFGTASSGIRQTIDLLEQIARTEAQQAIDGINQSISELMSIGGDGDRRSGIADFFDVNIFLAFTDAQRKARGEARQLTAEFLNQQTALANAKGDIDAQIIAMRSMLTTTQSLAEATGGVSDQERALIKHLAETLLLMEDQKGAMQGVDEATSGATTRMSGLAAEAARVAGEIERAYNAMVALSAQGISSLRESEIRLKYKGDPVATAGALAREKFGDITQFDPIMQGVMAEQRDKYVADATQTERNRQELIEWQKEQAKLGRAGRSGGGRTKLTEAERLQEMWLGRIQTATEKYNAELKDLNDLQEVGYLTSEQYSNAVALVTDEFERAEFGTIIDGIEGISDALADAIINGESMGDALRGVFRQIARDLLSSGIKSLLMDTFGFGGKKSGGGGLFSGLLSGVFGGFRADGGPVQAGKTYVTGERGPELFTPSTSGFITPNHELGQASGGGVLEVRLGPGLEAEWLAKSGMQSVQISTSAARSQQRALGGNISAYQARGTTG